MVGERRNTLSCWVAPKIAAEIWGLPLADILGLIANCRMPMREDGGFRFVQLPPFSSHGQPLPVGQRPPTFNAIDTSMNLETARGEEIVTPAERHALAGNPTDESEMGPPPDEDPQDNRIAGWREGRRRTSTMRRGPAKFGRQSTI
jgi:hypothetical protein